MRAQSGLTQSQVMSSSSRLNMLKLVEAVELIDFKFSQYHTSSKNKPGGRELVYEVRNIPEGSIFQDILSYVHWMS